MKFLLLSFGLIFSYLINAQKLGLSDHEKPELLLKLEAFEKQGGSFKPLGFDELNDKSYSTSIPLDVIPFASAEYFHIGFLTDFGRITDLSQAPIVLINSAPFEKSYTVAFCAENLEMFLALVAEVETVNLIDYLENREYMTQLDYDEILYEMEFGLEEPSISKEAWIQNLQTDRKKAIQYIKMQIGVVEIDLVSAYLNDLNQRRESAVIIKTEDGLGIVYQGDGRVVNHFNYEEEITVERVNKYLSEASAAERLKFYRDATFGESHDTFLFQRLSKTDRKQLRKVMFDYLSRDGYDYEAIVLKKFYK